MLRRIKDSLLDFLEDNFPLLVLLVVASVLLGLVYIGTSIAEAHRPPVTQAQVDALNQEMASAEPGDLIETDVGVFVFERFRPEMRYAYVVSNRIGLQEFQAKDLVRGHARLLKFADTPEFNAAARKFIKQ